jgi:biopolymer transport protein ExbB
MSTSALVDLAGTGATWVMYLLVALSAIQLALIIERGVVFYRSRTPKDFRKRVRDALGSGSMKAVGLAARGSSLEERVILAGAGAAERGVGATAEIMHSTLVEERLALERGLSFLGTLGNNAPFLGLFGTVLGIIHATADMASAATGQASRAVTGGISEALIATAIGLMVALPAVAAFNYFQRRIKTRVVSAEAIGGELVAELQSPIDSTALRTTVETRKAA